MDGQDKTRKIFHIPPALAQSSFFQGVDGIVYRDPNEINAILRERLKGVDANAQNQILNILLYRNRRSGGH